MTRNKVYQLVDRDTVRQDLRAELIAAMFRVRGHGGYVSEYVDGQLDGLAIALDIVTQTLEKKKEL